MKGSVGNSVYSGRLHYVEAGEAFSVQLAVSLYGALPAGPRWHYQSDN